MQLYHKFNCFLPSNRRCTRELKLGNEGLKHSQKEKKRTDKASIRLKEENLYYKDNRIIFIACTLQKIKPGHPSVVLKIEPQKKMQQNTTNATTLGLDTDTQQTRCLTSVHKILLL